MANIVAWRVCLSANLTNVIYLRALVVACAKILLEWKNINRDNLKAPFLPSMVTMLCKGVGVPLMDGDMELLMDPPFNPLKYIFKTSFWIVAPIWGMYKTYFPFLSLAHGCWFLYYNSLQTQAMMCFNCFPLFP